MRIYHLNCGLMAPFGGALFDGVSKGPLAKLACHCLLLETDHGLVLVDTGFGMKDARHPHRRISPFFIVLDNIQFDPELTAICQIERLGFSPRDVRHIVMTHLDFDHTGGIEDLHA
jgi:glyoxylase-like metal-dependent hydrolase (beta-lactamase superfamily II)